jgi:hypothetical protein
VVMFIVTLRAFEMYITPTTQALHTSAHLGLHNACNASLAQCI